MSLGYVTKWMLSRFFGGPRMRPSTWFRLYWNTRQHNGCLRLRQCAIRSSMNSGTPTQSCPIRDTPTAHHGICPLFLTSLDMVCCIHLYIFFVFFVRFTNGLPLELSIAPSLNNRLVPPHVRPALAARGIDLDNFKPLSKDQMMARLDWVWVRRLRSTRLFRVLLFAHVREKENRKRKEKKKKEYSSLRSTSSFFFYASDGFWIGKKNFFFSKYVALSSLAKYYLGAGFSEGDQKTRQEKKTKDQKKTFMSRWRVTFWAAVDRDIITHEGMGFHSLEFSRCLRQLLGGKSDTLSAWVCLPGIRSA